MHLLPGLIGSPVAAVRRLREVVVSNGASLERRPVQTGPGRAYLPARGVHRAGNETVAEAMQGALEAVEGVHWAAVNPILAEVAVAFDDGTVSVDDLAGILGGVEEAHGLAPDDFLADPAAHPSDPVPLQPGLVPPAAAAGRGWTRAAATRRRGRRRRAGTSRPGSWPRPPLPVCS